jgi:hypothetical protein
MTTYYVSSTGVNTYPTAAGTVGDEWTTFASAVAKHVAVPFATDDILEIESGVTWREEIEFTALNNAMTIKSDIDGTYFTVTPSAEILAQIDASNWGAKVGDEYPYTQAVNDRVTFIEDGVRIVGRMNNAAGTDPSNFFPQVGSLAAGEFAVDTGTNTLWYRPTGDTLDKVCQVTSGAASGFKISDSTAVVVLQDIHAYGGCGDADGAIYYDNCRNYTLSHAKGSNSWRGGIISTRTCKDFTYDDVWADDILWHGVGQTGFAPNSWTLTSITSASTTATATFPSAHFLTVGDIIGITGANETEYNGEQTVVSVPSPTTLTYAFAGSATSPATGTITGEDHTIRQCTMNTIKATRVNWLKSDTGDGNAIMIQPYKDCTGADWTIETVGNETWHTTAHKTYIDDNNLGGLLADNAVSFDTPNAVVNRIYSKDACGSGLQMSGSITSVGIYTPTQSARDVVIVNCGLCSSTISSSHNPLTIFANKDSTLDATVNGVTISGGKSGSATGLDRGAIDMYANQTSTGSTLTANVKRAVVDGTTGDHNISIAEQTGCTVNYNGNNNNFNIGSATPYHVQRAGTGGTSTDLAGWRTASTGDANSVEGDPDLIIGAATGLITEAVHPTTQGAAYHAGQSISALNDYYSYPFNSLTPTMGAIEFPRGTVKSVSTGLYLASFDTAATWVP